MLLLAMMMVMTTIASTCCTVPCLHTLTPKISDLLRLLPRGLWAFVCPTSISAVLLSYGLAISTSLDDFNSLIGHIIPNDGAREVSDVFIVVLDPFDPLLGTHVARVSCDALGDLWEWAWRIHGLGRRTLTDGVRRLEGIDNCF